MYARIRSIRSESDRINSYVLEPLAGEHFPAFTAGAHIDVRLTDSLARSYSLLNDPAEADRYEIAVQLEPEGRGGSAHIHTQWRPGQVIEIAEPRNNFPLREDAAATVLIAGGIGITPMLSMMERLEALGRSWQLHYAARSRAHAAFLDRLEARWPGRFVFHDDSASGAPLDLRTLINAADARAHLYCCGPGGMLDAFRALSASRPAECLHLEYFSANVEAAVDGGYTLELRRSGKTLEVACGESMLDALLNAGVNVGFACSEGICGSCKVGVLDGVPDHRDQFLSPDEKDANNAVMVCCSGAKTATLALDL